MQPALLYIVPGVIGIVGAHCLWNGDVKMVRTVSFLSMVFDHIISLSGTLEL